MTTRTVKVSLTLEAAAYLRNAREVQKATREIRDEARRLEQAGASMTRGGLISMLAGVPGVASAAAAGIGLVPAAALSGAAALSTLLVATNGVGDALSAVADDDAAKLVESMSKLTAEAQNFVREYQRVKPALDSVADSAQSAFFAQLEGDLERLTAVYIPTLLRQMPQLSTATARIGTDFVAWATAPATVVKVNRQFELAIDLAEDLGRMLRAGAGAMLDLADAGADFTRGTVDGLADGVEAFQRWVSTARATGELNAIFDNGARILQRLGEFAGQAAELLADLADNPALVDGAEALFDVLGLTLDIVHGLLLAFETLPSGVQSTVVTFAVFGGAALLVTGRVLALKASLDAAKVSAVQAGVAVRGVTAMLGGPWGVAIAAATVALGVYSASQVEADARADEFRSTLDAATGAITQNTHALVANQLEQKGFLALGAKYGITGQEMVDAILQGGTALDELRDKVTQLATLDSPDFNELAHLKAHLGVASKEAQGFVGAQQRVGAATSEAAGAVRGQINAIRTLGEELRAQTDPAFALIKAQRDLKTAQVEYNEAVKEHGKNSPQAKEASLALAEASVTLAGAVAEASEKFNGQLTPQLYATLKAAGLTEDQIADVEKAFGDAAKAGGEFAGDYTANVHANTTQADKALQDTINKTLQLKDKTIRISAQVYWTNEGNLHVPGGTQLRRWGGIDYAMAGGGMIPAHVATRPTILFGERATGDEAFIPRFGDHERNMATLREAASWERASVVPWDGGGGGGAGNSYSTAYNIYPQQANFGVNELRAVQAARDAYDRVGRPR